MVAKCQNTNMSKSAKQGNIPQSNLVSKSEINRKSINLLNKNVIKIRNYNIYINEYDVKKSSK